MVNYTFLFGLLCQSCHGSCLFLAPLSSPRSAYFSRYAVEWHYHSSDCQWIAFPHDHNLIIRLAGGHVLKSESKAKGCEGSWKVNLAATSPRCFSFFIQFCNFVSPKFNLFIYFYIIFVFGDPALSSNQLFRKIKVKSHIDHLLLLRRFVCNRVIP